MNDGKRPKPRRWNSVSDPKRVITAEVDRVAYEPALTFPFESASLTGARGDGGGVVVGVKIVVGDALERMRELLGESVQVLRGIKIRATIIQSGLFLQTHFFFASRTLPLPLIPLLLLFTTCKSG